MATGAMSKLDQLDKVEKEVVSCLYTAGQALAEIAKVRSLFLLNINFFLLLENMDLDFKINLLVL